jgi:Lipase (class 3)
MSDSVFDVNDVLLGTQYASLAITDDEEDTLKKVGKMNPWHIEALTLITGSNEEAHKPLTYILDKYMSGLELDWHIDKVGMTPGGHFLDTQGYIAHNDDTIVLSYRCTTSIFDWLTNLNAGSSEWELDEDIAQGFSGRCSELEGLLLSSKPEVHTGFYNNFLATVPDIKKYIEPLLAEDQPPRKLFVCGHSLGAGIATLAGCYFLLQHDWSELPHQLVIVTVGSPRACQNSMKEVVQAEVSRLKTKGCSDKVMTYRVVRDQDLVTTLPPSFLGYHHLDNLVFIFEDGSIDFVADGEEANGDEVEISAAVKEVPSSFTSVNDDDDENDTPYEEKIQNIPKAIRDHMPDFYLKPMLVARLQK